MNNVPKVTQQTDLHLDSLSGFLPSCFPSSTLAMSWVGLKREGFAERVICKSGSSGGNKEVSEVEEVATQGPPPPNVESACLARRAAGAGRRRDGQGQIMQGRGVRCSDSK